MIKHDELEKRMCNFEIYLKQTMDILKDSYQWKLMSEHCEDMMMKEKYMNVSNTLFELFMVEHDNIGNMFKKGN